MWKNKFFKFVVLVFNFEFWKCSKVEYVLFLFICGIVDLSCVLICLKMFDMMLKDMVNVCIGIELILVMFVSNLIVLVNLRKIFFIFVFMYFFNFGILWLIRCMYLLLENVNCIKFFFF